MPDLGPAITIVGIIGLPEISANDNLPDLISTAQLPHPPNECRLVDTERPRCIELHRAVRDIRLDQLSDRFLALAESSQSPNSM